jgi:hypothetical protein
MAFGRVVKSPQRLPRIMSLVLTGTGTAAVSGTCSSHVTLTDNGTGDYTLTFGEAFVRAPEVIVTTATTNSYALVTAQSTTACTIKTFKVSDQTALDAVMNVLILGSDAELI